MNFNIGASLEKMFMLLSFYKILLFTKDAVKTALKHFTTSSSDKFQLFLRNTHISQYGFMCFFFPFDLMLLNTNLL